MIKKLALLLGVALGVAHGQVQFPYVIYTTVDPTGNACSFGAPSYIVFATGVLYDCKNGVYAAVGGSGSGTVTSVGGTANQIDVANPTTTPVISLDPSLILPAGTTGLPVATGISGLGTGVATALAVNVGSAGAPVVNGGALGTPSSGLITNLTGTCASCTANTVTSLASPPAIGGTTPAAGAFTTLSSSVGNSITSGNAYLTGRADNAVFILTSNNTAAVNLGPSNATNLAQYNNTTHVFTTPSGFTATAGPIIQGSTKFTTSGCSVSSTTGNGSAGIFTLGANTCTVVITFNGASGLTAPTGWSCDAHDRTTIADIIGGESSSTQTTASIVIPVTVGATDVISFKCSPF